MTYSLDVECYPNFFMIGLKKLKGPYLSFEKPDPELKRILCNSRIITFNGCRYDFLMTAAFLNGFSNEELFKISKMAIEGSLPDHLRLLKNDFIYKKNLDLVDLIDIAPGVMVSLKMYGARMHYKNLSDLPYPPETILNEIQKDEIRIYNKKDLAITEMLYFRLKDEIDLRVNLKTRLRTEQNLLVKGNAALGEFLVINDLPKRQNYPRQSYVVYEAPKEVKFKDPTLNGILEDLQSLKYRLDASGKPILEGEVFKKLIKIGQTSYKIGLGGLHSQEKNLIKKELYNADVTSFYPSLILEYRFKPSGYGPIFLDNYRRIYDERVRSKANGDHLINSAYKLALNSVFGKLGNKYSALYDPAMLLSVTLTGQLFLLMLIEMLEGNGCNVVSANTDGVEFQNNPGTVLSEWEGLTRMKLESESYEALYSRDVNNYIAIHGNKVKSKGIYAEPDLKKSWEHPIVFKAIKDFVSKGIPIEETILSCKDLREFLLLRNVTGGAIYRGEFKGRVARWYYSLNGTTIHYAKNNNRVPKSENAKFVDVLDSINIPKDLDKEYYIGLTKKTFPINAILNRT